MWWDRSLLEHDLHRGLHDPVTNSRDGDFIRVRLF